MSSIPEILELGYYENLNTFKRNLCVITSLIQDSTEVVIDPRNLGVMILWNPDYMKGRDLCVMILLVQDSTEVVIDQILIKMYI